MPVLDWIGKDKVINHHLEVPYRVLEHQYSFDKNGKHDEDNGSDNMIIHGDNLEALKSLLPQYEGQIKCIYIDPPYNTGNEKWIYNDNVNDPRHRKWLGEVVGKEGEDLSRHDKWLCMMYPRLKLLRRLLSDDGVIFISIDDNEQANLKLICDEIFGENNSIGPFIQNKQNAKSDSINVQKNHEYILAYRKKLNFLSGNKIMPSLVNFEEKERKIYEENDKFYYLNDAITTRGEGGVLNARPNLGYSVYYKEETKEKLAVVDYDIEKAKYSNSVDEVYQTNESLVSQGFFPIRPPKVRGKLGCWTWSVEKFNNESCNISITGTYPKYAVKKRTFVSKKDIVNRNGKLEYLSYVERNSKSILEFSTNAGTKELNFIMNSAGIFDNPKNVSLIKYLIKLLNDKNAIILDSFAGSGTTAHAVESLNQEDGGNRKYILIEMMEYAETITAERIKRVIRGYGDGNKKIEGTDGHFSYYELGEQIFKGEKLNESLSEKEIRKYVYFSETKQRLETSQVDKPYYMGTHVGSSYYFYYKSDQITILNRNFLSTIKIKSESYVIFADLCTLSSKELADYNITFKKIPRDITRL